MFLYVAIGLVLVGHAYSLHHIHCDHYSTATYDSVNDPCTEEEFKAENNTCNRTGAACSKLENAEDYHCYVLWSNTTDVKVVRKGCWTNQAPCKKKNVCVGNMKSKNNLIFCCCDAQNCNKNFMFIEKADEGIDMEPTKEIDSDSPVIQGVLYGLLALFVIIVIFSTVCLYKRRKKPFDGMEIASVETPSSRMTSSTIQTMVMPAELKYPQLIELKARGRYGCVWKAQLQDRYVAVKIFFLSDKKSWQNEKEIFETELMHEHPNILHYIAAPCRGTGVDMELWLITDFHTHGSLADFLKVRTLTLDEALKFIRTMATGLSFLHRDIVCRGSRSGYKPAIAHRDLKSKNVLIKEDLTACIADFGLAVKFDPGESSGESHGQVGTRRYMAPEILEGAINFHRDAFLRIDMYAFALIMWEILTRCSEAPGYSIVYAMPYEKELGQNPTLEEMQDHVADRKGRPYISNSWRQHEVIGILCATMEDSWDQDAEARISAGCVEERLENLLRNYSASSNTPYYSINSNLITDSLPTITSNTETQNQLNVEKNEVNQQQQQQANDTSPLLETDVTENVIAASSTC